MTSRRSLLAGIGGLGAGGLAGCSGRQRPTPTSGAFSTPGDAPADAHAFTHLRANGNRVVEGAGRLPVAPVDVPLDSAPTWVLGVAAPDGPRWVVVDEVGAVRAITLDGETPTDVRVTPDRLPAGTPPVATVDGEGVRLLAPPPESSTRTHPFPLEDGRLLAIDADGALVRADEGSDARLDIGCLPDARIVAAGEDRVAVLAGATDRYGHGALGDDIEASEVVTVAVDDGLDVVARGVIPEPAVVEGVAPIAAAPGDGLLVTESDGERGARLAVYEGSDRVAEGPSIGQGFRWRHQLCVAPFTEEREVAVVRTPHIGGTVEFYRRRDGRLDLVASIDGASSHASQSRNLDGGVAGDLDGDGSVELLVPSDDGRTLRAIRREGDGATEAWTLDVGGALTTNLHAVATDGRIAVAAGRGDGLRVWV